MLSAGAAPGTVVEKLLEKKLLIPMVFEAHHSAPTTSIYSSLGGHFPVHTEGKDEKRKGWKEGKGRLGKGMRREMRGIGPKMVTWVRPLKCGCPQALWLAYTFLLNYVRTITAAKYSGKLGDSSCLHVCKQDI